MTCAELEILLCDYVDGALQSARKSEVEEHLAVCVACSEFARDVTGAVGFMERVAVVDPPPELLTRILHEAPPVRPPWWRRGFLSNWTGGWFEALLQPRYAMGMAMTVLSFSMLRFAHINVRQLQPSDLDPVKIYLNVDDRAHRSWDRAMKYYENLRWVIEVQSRFKELTDQEQELQKSPGADKTSAMPEGGAKK